MGGRLKYIHFPIWFFIACAIYFVVRVFRMTDIGLPETVNSYLTDFICLPIILMICLNVVKFLKRDSELELGILPIAIVFIEYSLIFEFIAPRNSNLYSGDIFDVLMYLIGAFFFYFLQSMKKKIIVKKIINQISG